MTMAREYDIESAFAAIEDELIDSMMRNMKRHRVEEVAEDKQWEMWQSLQLKALEEYKKKNQKKFTSWYSDINGQIEDVIREARNSGQMEQEIEILKAIQNGFKGFRRSSGAMQAEFFRLNERKLEALIKSVTDDMKRAETAILRMANDQYRKAIFNAQVYANSGAGTYEKAVDMATKDMLSSGLNCIEYANGARHTLKDYADMAIRTASKRAYLQGEGEMRKSWGISTVIMNKRENPCPKCLPFCGKVMIDDVWSGGSSDGISPVTGIEYPLMSKAIDAGLYHPRCKDSHTTYFEGVNTPPDDTYTKEELNKIADDYREEQKQQYARRQAEKFERLADNSLDDENQKRYAARREEWKNRHMEITEKNLEIPDFSNMDFDTIEKWAKDNLKTTFSSFKGVNSEFASDAVEVIAEFERKMGGRTIDGLKIQFGGLPKGVYAKYDDTTKTLILKKTGSKKAFEESQKEINAKSRFKLRNSTVNQSKDYYATDTYKGTIWHEIGHAVDVDSGQDLSRALSQNAKLDVESVRISQYAGSTQGIRVTKRSEAWAENFAAYMEGGSKAKDVPYEIQEMIENYFKKNEQEFSPRKSIVGDFGVNWREISSVEYRKRIEKLSDNPKVVDAIEVRAKWALNNRDGLKTEELYAINLDTGEEIASVLGQQIDFGIKRTKAFTMRLDTADSAGNNILLIHNHPRGLPPSLGDINALMRNKNISGITVGHDGSLYHYTRPKKTISDDDFNIALKHFSGYTEITAMEKTLELLSKKYGFKFEKL